jgi:hypothetical protein
VSNTCTNQRQRDRRLSIWSGKRGEIESNEVKLLSPTFEPRVGQSCGVGTRQREWGLGG